MELIVVKEFNAVQIFNGENLDPLLERIKKQVNDFVPDTSTAKGRKEIAALAHKVAKSKTFLDSAGKELVSDWKNKAKVVDIERKKMRDYLDDLKLETRQPLTDWETDELKRVDGIKARIEEFVTMSKEHNEAGDIFSVGNLNVHFEYIKNVEIDDSFAEFGVEAATTKDAALRVLEKLIARRTEEEAEKAELERLRRESEASAKADAEEKLRKEGEERARLKAESEARAEKDRVELEAKKKAAAEQKERDRIEAEKQAAIDAQIEAERKAKEADERAIIQAEQAKQDTINAKIKSDQDAFVAKERARIEVENAAKVERDRVERERQAEAKAVEMREADVEHKKTINNAAMDAFILCGLEPEDAKKVVVAIAYGRIPHVKIGY